MIGGQLRAPQYGVFCELPPVSDNPADARRTRGPSQAMRAHLAALRASIAATARGPEFTPNRKP